MNLWNPNDPPPLPSIPGAAESLFQKYALIGQPSQTPDDEVVNISTPYKQARPNVIYEVGWFIGRLGKERVTLLLKHGTNIHSDLDGVSRIPFLDNVEDKFLDIQKELKAAKIIA